MTIGICILNWNAGDKLRECIESVRTSLRDQVHSIVVVDNNSTDGSIESIHDRDIKVIRNSSNVGYARGNNIGAHHLLRDGCTYLMFVNPDVSITPGTVASLLAGLASDATIGCCGGVPLTAGIKSRMAARNKPTGPEKLFLYGPFGRWFRRLQQKHFIDLAAISAPTRVYAISGACLLFKAEAFRSVNGFDEHTFLFEEEFIMSERLTTRDWSIAISPWAFYTHIESHSTLQIPNRRHLHFIRSEQYLLKTYYRWAAIARFGLLLVRVMELPAFIIRNLFPRRGRSPENRRSTRSAHVRT